MPEDAGDEDVHDAIPLEWIRRVEREAAADRAKGLAKHQRAIFVVWSVAAVLVFSGLIALNTVGADPQPAAQPTTPAEVTAFAQNLPASQQPNAAGVTVVDGTNAPSTWRVAWETVDQAFCFAFVHQSEPPQTVCGAPGSVRTAQMRIGGELSDTGLNPPELFTCGYTTGDEIAYVEINDAAVVGTAVDMGSGLSAYCLQLPYDMTAGQSFTVSTNTSTQGPNGKYAGTDVTATYP